MDMAVVTARATMPTLKFLVSKSYRRSCKELVSRRNKLRVAVRQTVEEYGPRFNEYWDKRVVPEKFFQQEAANSADEKIPFCPLSKSYEQTPTKKDMFEGLADGLFDEGDSELL